MSRSNAGSRLARMVPVLLFLAWTAVGAGLVFAVLGWITVGVIVGPIAAVALLLWPGSRNSSSAGLVSGAGVIALYVGYLNRDGPGTVCHVTGTASSCVDEWSPWPWLAFGVLLVAGGVALRLWLRGAHT